MAIYGLHTEIVRASDGSPAVGSVSVYQTGTTTLATLARDENGTTAQDNPVQLDRGRLTFYTSPGAVDLLLPDGTTVEDVQIAGDPDELAAGATIITPVLTLKQSATPTPTAEGDIQWDTDGNFILVGDGATAKTFTDDSLHLLKAGNLDGLASASTSRTNLGLGGAAILAVGTTSGDVAAGDQPLSRATTAQANAYAYTDAQLLADAAPRQSLWLDGTSGVYASAPYVAGLALVGDLDVQAVVALDDWTPAADTTIVGRWDSAGDERGFRLMVQTTGELLFQWSTSGAVGTVVAVASTAATGFANGAIGGIRATLDVDNGAAGNTVTFYTSTDEGATWVALGDPVITATASSVFNTATQTLDVGANGTAGGSDRLTGRVLSATVKNGIAGTTVASPKFTAPVNPRHADGQANIWTINGSAWAWKAS